MLFECICLRTLMGIDTSEHVRVLQKVCTGEIVFTIEIYAMYCVEHAFLLNCFLLRVFPQSARLPPRDALISPPAPPPFQALPLPPPPPSLLAPSPRSSSTAATAHDDDDERPTRQPVAVANDTQPRPPFMRKRSVCVLDLADFDSERNDLLDVVNGDSISSELKRFKCRRCGKIYASTDGVRKHARKRHKDWIEHLPPSEYAMELCAFPDECVM